MTLSARAILLATSAIIATSASAQDAVELDTIRIESDAAQDLLGNTEITEEEIANRNPQTMADVFAGETSIASSGGAPIAQKVTVNGIEESLLSVTIDGARQNKSPFHHTGNVLIDPTLLKRAEISSGLAPADQGPGALAGSIAYETKDARDLLEPGKNFGGRVSLGYADNGESFRRSLTIFGREGGFEYLLSGTRSTGSDYTDGSGVVMPYTAAGLSNYVGKLAYTSDAGKRLEFSFDHTEDSSVRAGQAAGGNVFIRPDFRDVGGTVIPVQAQYSRKSYTLTYTDEAPQGIWAPTVQLAYNEQELNGQAVTKGQNTSLSGTIKNEFDVGGGALTAGVDFFRDTAENISPLVAGTPSKETLTNVGVFAQMRQDVGSALSLSYGARADFQNFSAPDGSTYKASGLSVNAAADFKLTEALSLNIGLASVWGGYELSEASLINMGGGGPGFGPSPWTYSNIEASRANNARIGLRYDQGPWSASGAFFYTKIDNAPYVLNQNRTTGGVTNPDLTSKGFDASFRYSVASGYFQANYTYADVQLNGAPIGTTAYYFGRPVGHMIGLSSAFEVAPGLTLGGTAEIALEQNDRPTTLPGYEVLNLFASYTPQQYKNIEVRLDVRNVFNATYSKRTGDGIDFGPVTPLTEPGRTIGLTVSAKF